MTTLQANLPDWLTATIFEKLLQKNVVGYQRIKNFKPYPAMAPGENYATLMLRVEIEVELKDGKTKSLSYMLKVPTDNSMMKEMMSINNFFDNESSMYLDVVPEMEQMLRDAGVDVTFGANCYKLDTDNNYILLEDLRPRGFKNANRLEGLDMEHTKAVLRKLAQWHAASATRVQTKGNYSKGLTYGFYQDSLMPMMKSIFESLTKIIVNCIKNYEGYEVYGESVVQLQNQITEEIFKLAKIDPNEFNVLNHGDCWCNNIMFQYDAYGKIKETYFVDFQIGKFGSPAQDLYYFLFSSTKYELKLSQFDFFIKYYYDNLLEHLQLLKYPKKMPSLKDIHLMMCKYSLWGYCTATGVMSAVLLDPNENASMDNFLGDDEAGNDFKTLLFSNPRYRKHMEILLPWLYNRGALECTT